MRIAIFRQSFGPHTSAAGAVWPIDILRCRCGQLQRPWSRHPDDSSDLCLACGGTVFAEPSPAGYCWLLGTGLSVRARRTAIQCSTCGAGPGQPCRSLGRLTTTGSEMQTVHAARKRAAKRTPCAT